MRCNEIEELLPRYIENDCGEIERREIEHHLGSCASCRASLEAFEELERSLAGLRETIPAWKHAEAELARRTCGERRRIIPSSLWNPTTLCGCAIAALGVVLGLRGELTIAAMRTFGSRVQVFVDAMSAESSRVLEGSGNFGAAALLSIYLLLIALPLLAFGAACVRMGKR